MVKMNLAESAVNQKKIRVVLIKPSKYDDEGYVIRHFRGVLPSNTLVCLYGLTRDVAKRELLGADVELQAELFDDSVQKIPVGRIIRSNKHPNVRTIVALVGVQSGLTLAGSIAPGRFADGDLIAGLWGVGAGLTFFALDGHQLLLAALGQSFGVAPLVGSPLASEMLRLSARMFPLSLAIAAPILISLLLVDMALGTAARSLPGLNVFFVTYPLKAALTLADGTLTTAQRACHPLSSARRGVRQVKQFARSSVRCAGLFEAGARASAIGAETQRLCHQRMRLPTDSA